MGTKLTFKEYLDSKEKLRAAIKETPHQVTEYMVNKYCKLIVGESKDEKEQINLKPNQMITVEWLYNDIDNPTALKIMFEGVCSDIDTEEYKSYWQPYKLQKWLSKNTSTKNPIF